MKLSIVIPAYNEGPTIYTLLSTVGAVSLDYNWEKEMIIVNDCSKDNTESEIERFISDHPDLMCRYYKHDVNQGKGAALHTGFKSAEGDYVIVQDADLEYDPEEFNLLLVPVEKAGADVVYGSRFAGGQPHRMLFYWHSKGNKFLTGLSNMFSNLNLTDMETCYKLVRRDILQSFKLKEKRFGFEPEITAKLSRVPNVKIYEVGISIMDVRMLRVKR